jgi:hypothetical protein
MLKDRDKLLGVPQADQKGGRRTGIPLTVTAVVTLMGVVVGFVGGRLTVESSSTQIPAPRKDLAVAVHATDRTVQPPTRSAPANTLAVAADKVITDRLLADPATYEQLENESVTTTVCLGQTLRVANISHATVGLVDTPEYSDADAELGIVKPGGVFTLRPKERGIFYLSASGRDGLLFRYQVERCRKKGP